MDEEVVSGGYICNSGIFLLRRFPLQLTKIKMGLYLTADFSAF